jgi:hypothetical protein
MMSNRNNDILFQLIRSLEKSEKRHFKLYIRRSSARDDLKIIRVFDTMDKMQEYDEKLLLKKMQGVTKPQLANLKTHLYKQLLSALRLLKITVSIDLQLSEHLDHARLLYQKGLKLQALKLLEKAKELARENHKYNYLAQVISLEKKIETLHITRSGLERTETLSTQATDISGHIDRVVKLSNLALLLYGWYVKNGHARNALDEDGIRKFFSDQLPPKTESITDFYELLYLYQSFCWYAFIRQDFLQYYRYSQKWIDLYRKEPLMIKTETGHYVKGMHNLLNAHFVLRNFKKFPDLLKEFEDFDRNIVPQLQQNFRIHTSVYINSAKLNWHLMTGSFKEGLHLIPGIERRLEEDAMYLDVHRILVFNYKMAMLHFGAGQYAKTIDYLQKIINGPAGLRKDLQCYSRLLHLIAHYELGNDSIIESLIKSVYRFMSKMENLTVIEEEMFRFLRRSFGIHPALMKPELERFYNAIKHLEKNRFETRALNYLDIISWLESKIQNKTMGELIHQKYIRGRKVSDMVIAPQIIELNN